MFSDAFCQTDVNNGAQVVHIPLKEKSTQGNNLKEGFSKEVIDKSKKFCQFVHDEFFEKEITKEYKMKEGDPSGYIVGETYCQRIQRIHTKHPGRFSDTLMRTVRESTLVVSLDYEVKNKELWDVIESFKTKISG